MGKLYLDGKEVLADVYLKGTLRAIGTVTLPAVTLGGTLTLNGQAFDAGSGSAQINTTGSNEGLTIQGSHGTTSGVILKLLQIDATPDGNENPGIVKFAGNNTTPAEVLYGEIRCLASDPTPASEVSSFQWYLQNSGSNLAMTLSGAGELGLDLGVDADEYYKVAGTQVVSAQGAAVANPTDAASTQARLIDLLDRLRTHGLIAT